VLKHLWGDVPRNRYYGGIAGLGLRKLCNGVVTKIMEAQTCQGAFEAFDSCVALLVGANVCRFLEPLARGTENHLSEMPP
jgi:hypothetical protein